MLSDGVEPTVADGEFSAAAGFATTRTEVAGVVLASVATRRLRNATTSANAMPARMGNRCNESLAFEERGRVEAMSKL